MRYLVHRTASALPKFWAPGLSVSCHLHPVQTRAAVVVVEPRDLSLSSAPGSAPSQLRFGCGCCLLFPPKAAWTFFFGGETTGTLLLEMSFVAFVGLTPGVGFLCRLVPGDVFPGIKKDKKRPHKKGCKEVIALLARRL